MKKKMPEKSYEYNMLEKCEDKQAGIKLKKKNMVEKVIKQIWKKKL